MSDLDTTPMKRRCPHNDLLTEAFGVSGKNGRVGVLEQKVRKIEETQFRLVLLTCTGSALGGGIVAGVVKLFA
jgi:hypothetical protein